MRRAAGVRGRTQAQAAAAAPAAAAAAAAGPAAATGEASPHTLSVASWEPDDQAGPPSPRATQKLAGEPAPLSAVELCKDGQDWFVSTDFGPVLGEYKASRRRCLLACRFCMAAGPACTAGGCLARTRITAAAQQQSRRVSSPCLASRQHGGAKAVKTLRAQTSFQPDNVRPCWLRCRCRSALAGWLVQRSLPAAAGAGTEPTCPCVRPGLPLPSAARRVTAGSCARASWRWRQRTQTPPC